MSKSWWKKKKRKIKFLYLKNWLTQLLRLVKSKTNRLKLAGWRPRKKEPVYQFKNKGLLLVEPRLDLRSSVFCSFQAFNDCMRLTHTSEGNLPYSKSATLNVNLIERNPHKNIHNNVWLHLHIWAPWPTQVDMKLAIIT